MQRNYKAAPARSPRMSNKNFSASFYIPNEGGNNGGDDVSVVSDTTGRLCLIVHTVCFILLLLSIEGS